MQSDKEKQAQPANSETREVFLGDAKTSDLDEKLLDIESAGEGDEAETESPGDDASGNAKAAG